MPSAPVPVRWEIATDRGFSNVAQRGEAIARPELGHAVHVEVAGLDPDDVPPEVFLLRPQAAAQAFYEHMPLRRSAFPRGADMQLYRQSTLGRPAGPQLPRHPAIPLEPALR